MRLIDADKIIEIADHAYGEWNKAMACADGNREINLCFKRQRLCEIIAEIAKSIPTSDIVDETIFLTMDKYINQIERINTDRWNTMVCVELKCSLDCVTKEQYKQIKQEILKTVNNCKTDVFYNANTGEKTYKYVDYVCECDLDKEHREHFYLHN